MDLWFLQVNTLYQWIQWFLRVNQLQGLSGVGAYHENYSQPVSLALQEYNFFPGSIQVKTEIKWETKIAIAITM